MKKFGGGKHVPGVADSEPHPVFTPTPLLGHRLLTMSLRDHPNRSR